MSLCHRPWLLPIHRRDSSLFSWEGFLLWRIAQNDTCEVSCSLDVVFDLVAFRSCLELVEGSVQREAEVMTRCRFQVPRKSHGSLLLCIMDRVYLLPATRHPKYKTPRIIIRGAYAQERTRTSTSKRTQALNLLRMPIPPPGLVSVNYSFWLLAVNFAYELKTEAAGPLSNRAIWFESSERLVLLDSDKWHL